MANTGVTHPAYGAAPVYFRYGAVIEETADLGVSAPGTSWTFSRSYNSLASGTTMLGTQWFTNQTDYKLLQSGYDVALLVNASSKQTFTYSSGNYIAPKDTALTLVHNGDATFTLTDTIEGTVSIFYDFSGNCKGLLKEQTTLAWKAQGRSGDRYTWNTSTNKLTQITTSQGQDYNIVFTYTGNNISKIEVRTGADTSTRVLEVNYTYFTSGTHSADVGLAGNLVQVKAMELKTGGSPSNSADWIVRYTQYRYGSNGLLKMVLEPDAIQRILDNSSLNISSADAILTKGDDYDNSGASSHKVKEYANRRFTYYTADLATDNSNVNAKCLTAWAPTAGENLQSKYGGTNVNEIANYQYLVKSETVGACSSCGGSGNSFKLDYYYMNVSHGTANENEVVRLVVEDTSDGDGSPAWRTVYGLAEKGQELREARITDVSGTPQFWGQSWKLVADTGNKLNRLEEYRTPAAHNITTSNVSQFLNPYDVSGGWTNDTNTLNSSAGRIDVYEYNSDGYQTALREKVGSSGSAYYQWAVDCQGGANANRKAMITASYEYPVATTDRSASSRIQTQYSYTFWDSTDTIKTKTTTLPAVSTDQNGSGSSVTTTEYYDSYGRVRWTLDGRGYVTYQSYHPNLGSVAYVVRDANPSSLPTSADNNSSKWVTSSTGSASSNAPTRGGSLPTALQQVSRDEFDNQGRMTLTALEDGTTGTILEKHYSVYQTNATLKFPYWDDNTSRPLLPIQVTAANSAGKVTDQYAVDPARTATSSGVPTGLSAGTDQSHYVRWTHTSYDAFSGKLSAVARYHLIPASGYGAKDTNYAETAYGYDSLGRQARVVTPGGTISRTVYDAIGRDLSSWIGTDDTPTSGDWSPTNNSGANMVKTAQYEYDGGSAGGNSNRTKQIRYVSDDQEANARVTQFKYDARGRLVFTVDPQEYDSKALYSRTELDNLGRVTKTERYYDANDNSSFPSDGAVDNGDRLLARSESLYDNLGRVYRTKSYAVDPSDGTVGSALVGDIWFDASGNPIKRRGAGAKQFSKMVFDGLGRMTKRYLGYDTAETSYSDAGTVSGDTILEQSETVFDASENVLQTASYARKADASGTGELSTTTARPSYMARWYDGANRQTAMANYGTNGGATFTRPGTAPSPSDTVLVTTTAYDTAGQPYQTIDPAGKESRQEFDQAGRLTKTIANYTDGDPTTGTADQDVTVQMTYNSDGQVLTLTAKNPTTGDQITKYVYGTDQGGITPAVYRNDLLRSEISPDSDDAISPLGNGSDGIYDRIEYTYNRRGDQVQKTDPNGTVHAYDYDNLGRMLHDRVTTVGTGVDDDVLRISTTYDIRGQVERLTSYDNATVGSGNVVNEVVSAYDSNGRLTTDYQEHSGAKDANTLSVGHNYDTTSSSGVYTNGLRPISLVYPNGRSVHYGYGTSGETNDLLSRLATIGDGTNTQAAYTYLGASQIVVEDYVNSSLKLDYAHDDFASFDRFGRVVDQLWTDYGADPDVALDHYSYTYDRASNRTSKTNALSSALSESYTYDAVDRLIEWKVNNVSQKTWTLDPLGNNLAAGSYNAANEETPTQGSSGYDVAGNMTTLQSGNAAVYDAWNRTVKITTGSGESVTTIEQYKYDGAGRRIQILRDFTGSTAGTVQDDFFTGQQVIESDVTTDGARNGGYQYIWSPRYIDAAVLRDTLNTAGTSIVTAERVFYLSDANYNVTGLVKYDAGASRWAVAERYSYTPYGVVSYRAADWTTVSSSANANTILYTGRVLDVLTGLYYYRARYYDASLERFVGRDLIIYDSDDSNLYRYCGNSPLDKTDPTGLEGWSESTITYEITKCGEGRWNPAPEAPKEAKISLSQALDLANKALKEWLKKKNPKLVRHITHDCPAGYTRGASTKPETTEKTGSCELSIYVYFEKGILGYKPVISGDQNPDPNGHNGQYVVTCDCKTTIVDEHGPCVPCKKK